MLSRRGLLRGGAAALAAAGSGAVWPRHAAGAGLRLPPELPAGVRDEAILDALPGKRPLIKLTYRPPNYETPVEYFKSVLTPNDAFFVRYHLADIARVDAGPWRLTIGGDALSSPAEYSLDELKKGFETVELTAVCLCSGNRRGLFQPHVTGVEWGYGAMGNAKWRGVRLRDVLNKAGIKKEAVEVVLEGADGPVLDKTPDFAKSLPRWKALDENTLIAFEMNGAPLPHWNGFPARIVVPGWTATYWMKHVTSVTAQAKPFEGFWMRSAYRIPVGRFPIVDRFISQETEESTPITEMVVNSLVTSLEKGQRFRVGARVPVKGIAWDGGYGIARVDVSTDDGQSWQEAELGPDHGRFSFREFSQLFPARAGTNPVVRVAATNRIGQTQTAQLIENPAGYHHNVIQRIDLKVVL
jgi:DMSO/TMAO reductase YedYZ molybdopterin-dependent catalytic subunit